MSRFVIDLSPLRASRDLRLLIAGELVSGLGTQAVLVALPFQIYLETRSAFLTGLLGAVELIPLVAMSLLGGAIADRFDRRMLLLLVQIGLVLAPAGLAAITFAEDPPLWGLYVLGAALAGFNAVQNVVRSAIIPNLVEPRLLRSALALNFGLFQLTLVIGPGLGGAAHRLAGRRRGLRHRRRELSRDGGGGDRDVAAAAHRHRGAGAGDLEVDRRRDCGSSAATRRSWAPSRSTSWR